MTKKQLIKKLEKVADNTHIILASDQEGNTFLELREIYMEKGLKFLKTEGEIELNGKDAIDDMITESEYKKMKDCVVLFP